MIKLSEKLILGLIGITLVLPIPGTLLVHGLKDHLPSQFDWIANRTLFGVSIKGEQPPLKVSAWLNGDLQKGVNDFISEHFAGRELLIRGYNQILFSAFDKSYMSKEEIIHGRHGDLFQRWYVQVFDHDIDLLQSKEGEALVVMMKDLTERLKSVGSCFVFVITPTKASVYPEDIPDRYLTNLNRGDRRQSNYDILVPFLKNYDIPYVDGRQITFEHKDSLPVRAFPTTGTHWSRAIAFFSAAALLETMAREAGREMPELSESAISIDGTPDLEDSDLFRLLNLTERQTNVIFTPFLRSGTTGPNEKEF